jgi:4-hydroxy-tetrahydrodipicolinate reductase
LIEMIKVAVGGATGRLGGMVCDLIAQSEDLELVGALVSEQGGNIGRTIHGVIAAGPVDLEKVLEDADVYVDLTSAEAASGIIARVPPTRTALVIGTTAIPEEVLEGFEQAVERYGTSAVISPNFSIGVNVFWKACEMLAKALPGYDIEMWEIHHNRKRDSPSGTAVKAAEVLSQATGIDTLVHGREGIIGPRGREIGVHAIRAGDVIGDHTVMFAANMERIELTHRAISRQAFAEGCLAAVRWAAGRNDGKVHSMNEVLGL